MPYSRISGGCFGGWRYPFILMGFKYYDYNDAWNDDLKYACLNAELLLL